LYKPVQRPGSTNPAILGPASLQAHSVTRMLLLFQDSQTASVKRM
jgi:hypothetical protein